MGMLPMNERMERIETALSKLSPEDRARIEKMAEDLVLKVKAECRNNRSKAVPFSKSSALETIAAVGLAMLRGE
jgi:hypothetical protein